MRQLKFRIWNKATKSWLNDDAGTHLWSEYCINIFTGKIAEFITGDNKSFSRADEPNFYFNNMNYVKESPYVVQQYTGLKDKNGKMIFEGDIVHYVFDGASYPKEAKDEILICKWDQGNAWFVFVEDLNYDGNGYYWLEVRDRCEVIGNIFENKDLLKKEH
jgi:uncharacterized phage protein (TIGR01671 family)